METSVAIGKNAENMALTYLIANGFQLLDTNVRMGRNEIDIVVEKDSVMVFVEVKYRKNNDFGYPESFLSEKQMDRIREAAEAYIFQHDWQGEIRFDIVSVEANGKLTHFEDAF